MKLLVVLLLIPTLSYSNWTEVVGKNDSLLYDDATISNVGFNSLIVNTRHCLGKEVFKNKYFIDCETGGIKRLHSNIDLTANTSKMVDYAKGSALEKLQLLVCASVVDNTLFDLIH